MTIYNRIKKRREELGMSQQELANIMGYKSRSAINKIESGLRNINQNRLIDFANALQTTPAYLMGWDEAMKQLNTVGKNINDIADETGIPASEIERVISENNIESLEEATRIVRVALQLFHKPTQAAKESPDKRPEVTDRDIQFALFGGEVSDEAYEEVKNFAQYVREKYKDKKE